MRKILFLLAFSAVIVFSLAPAQADPVTLGFYNITNVYGNAANIATQLSVVVSEVADPTKVLFTFYNTGSIKSSISEIYFDDGALLSIVANGVTNISGVDFTTINVSPGDLPAGNSITPPFEATSGFVAGSTNPQGANGVNNYIAPGTPDAVSILFQLENNATFQSVLNALAIPNDTVNGLRIGLHVTALTVGSESFVNNPVPLPGAILLLGAGLVRLAAYARRRQED